MEEEQPAKKFPGATSAKLRKAWAILSAVIASVVLLATGYAAYRLLPNRAVSYADIDEHFKYGSTGAEVNLGIPYWIWQAAPLVCAESLTEVAGGRLAPDYLTRAAAYMSDEAGAAEVRRQLSREGVSAFPQAVTVEMLRNFAHGGGAINVLVRELGAILEVINLGTVNDPGPLEGVLDCRLGPGTENLSRAAAMSPEQCVRATRIGRDVAERAFLAGAQLFIGGEMGIGNTTAAAALASALLDLKPEQLAGPGAGLAPAGVAHKVEVIRHALVLHQAHLADPYEALRRLGGFEIAALTGSYLGCAQLGLPVLVDGFITSVAALAAARLNPGATHWFIFAHRSADPGSSSGARGHGRATAPRSGPAARRRQRRRGRGSLAAARLRFA